MENSAIIISIVSMVISAMGALIAVYKAKPERNKLEEEGRKLKADGLASIADGAESLAKGAESLGKAAEITNSQLLRRIEQMEIREVRREQDLAQMKVELESVTAQLKKWKDYAFRLAHQLEAHGLEPVPFDVRNS
jgi:hypothetical protein